MKIYEEPKMEVELFAIEDVITDSGDDNGVDTPFVPI
jgi:hypothetical protein